MGFVNETFVRQVLLVATVFVNRVLDGGEVGGERSLAFFGLAVD